MPEIGLQRAGILAVIRQLVPTGVLQHVRMRLDAKIGHQRGALNHPRKAGRGERRPPLRHEDEGRLRRVALQLAERAQLVAPDRMGGSAASLGRQAWKFARGSGAR